MTVSELPGTPGTYLLVLQVVTPVRLRVGALGEMDVNPGFYLYVGSACGPGGLRARVGRHFSGQGALRWHIDALRTAAQPVEAWCASNQRCEHAWAQSLAAAPECQVPMARFGSSDCRCPAHLFYLAQPPESSWLMGRLNSAGMQNAPGDFSTGRLQVIPALD